MVKTTIKGHPHCVRDITADVLIALHSGKAFVGCVSTDGCENNSKAIFWVSYHSVNVFQVDNGDYSKGGSWGEDSVTIFHIDRFIDIEVKEI